MKLACVAGVLLCLSVPFASIDASAQTTIKVGTLAPRASPWGKVFETWVKAVQEKSGGRLEIQFFYNGQQGDEGAMVAKVKAGQLDGVVATAVGLGKVYRPTLALQMPLFSSWGALDRARDAMKGEFERGAREAGFQVVGWGDVGLIRVMSRGFAVRVPDDIRGKKPFLWRDDAIMPAVYTVIGGVTPVSLNVPEVLPNLNTGAVNVLFASALAAEQLQWAGKVDHITDRVMGTAVGALVLSQRSLDALPADLRAIVEDTGRVAMAAMTTRIRSEDAAAYGRLQRRMTPVVPSADEQGRWDAMARQARQRLAQGTFSAELVQRLESMAQ